MSITITETAYSAMAFGLGSPGVCLACEEVDEDAGCEPDARGYECPACGEHQLYGLEEALIMGAITIT